MLAFSLAKSPLLLLVGFPSLLVLLEGKSINFPERRRGEIEGEDAEIDRQRSLPISAKELAMIPGQKEPATLQLPPLPPSAHPSNQPTAREFTFSMMIQPTHGKKLENLETDEGDEALLLPASHPHSSIIRRASSQIAFRGLVSRTSGGEDENSNDPFEQARRVRRNGAHRSPAYL